MHLLAAGDVTSAVKNLFVAKHFSRLHAQYVAETLVETSLDGIDTHGLRLLPTYIRELDGGRSNARPSLRFKRRLRAAAILNADGALGVVAGNVAMQRAVTLASAYGIGAVAVANSNHFGAAGYYAKIAASRNHIGLAFSNSDSLVRPHDGTTPLNGTNPIAMAAPSADGLDFVLDMATSETAVSKLLSSGATLSSILPLAPLGGYKGQGLGTMVQILCAALSEMPFDYELSHLYDPPFDAPRRVAHFFLSIDLGAFGQPARIKTRISRLLEHFRASSSARTAPVRVAGDVERLAREERLRDGIPVSAEVYGALKDYLGARDAVAI